MLYIQQIYFLYTGECMYVPSITFTAWLALLNSLILIIWKYQTYKLHYGILIKYLHGLCINILSGTPVNPLVYVAKSARWKSVGNLNNNKYCPSTNTDTSIQSSEAICGTISVTCILHMKMPKNTYFLTEFCINADHNMKSLHWFLKSFLS